MRGVLGRTLPGRGRLLLREPSTTRDDNGSGNQEQLRKRDQFFSEDSLCSSKYYAYRYAVNQYIGYVNWDPPFIHIFIHPTNVCWGPNCALGPIQCPQALELKQWTRYGPSCICHWFAWKWLSAFRWYNKQTNGSLCFRGRGSGRQYSGMERVFGNRKRLKFCVARGMREISKAIELEKT